MNADNISEKLSGMGNVMSLLNVQSLMSPLRRRGAGTSCAASWATRILGIVQPSLIPFNWLDLHRNVSIAFFGTSLQ